MHAVCITAYKDHAQLVRLIKRFDPTFFKVFVHLDRRNTSFKAPQIDQLYRLGCEVHKKYGISWGSFSHLQAILFLIQRAVAKGGIDYVHVISGQDYPIRNWKEFERRCDGSIFLHYGILDNEQEDVQQRYYTFNTFYFLQGASRVTNRLHRYLKETSLWAQKCLGLKRLRLGRYDPVYKGPVWCSLPLAAARLLHSKAARDYLREVRTTFVPEEIYLQTFFLHSDLGTLVSDDDLRYTDWTFRNGSVPAFLDETDAMKLEKSTALFARKMDSAMSAKLLDIIDERHFGSVPVDHR